MSMVILEAIDAPRRWWRKLGAWLHKRMPKGLYARALLILILPIVLLQSAVAYVYMERHWEAITDRLSAAVARDASAIVEIYRSFPEDKSHEILTRIAGVDLSMQVTVRPPGPLPEPMPRPFFSLLDHVLSRELASRVKYPFWIDTSKDHFVVIQIALDDATLELVTTRTQAYASNSHIFFIWTTLASVVILGIAMSFLRNQIRPILRLAKAAEEFGKGRDAPFRPRGAREVRQAGAAFLEMKQRVERAIEQRTTMLNGVSHDLRTIITRFKLSLSLLEKSADVGELRKDVDEMENMVEAYLAFARGDAGEAAAEVDVGAILKDLQEDSRKRGIETEVSTVGATTLLAKPASVRRLLSNLVGNAQRYGKRIELAAINDRAMMTIHIDDDGPGIPVDRLEDAFRPFYRLDEARNQDNGNSGLGLAIARDIARGHGGDVTLERSPRGGLRAKVTLPI
jgi:two-component system osmolarity sensor histidine kinase EnvZ